MKILTIFIIILLLLGAYMIISSSKLNLENKEDQKTFVKQFSSWISKLVGNLKQLTSQAVKQDWLPVNNTKNA